MKFNKIKFNTKNKTIEVSYTIHDGTALSEITTKFGNIVHSDFIEAINSLRYHFARLTDLRECTEINEREEAVTKLCEHTALKGVTVTSIVFNESCDTNMVCLSGSKRFDDKFINITSPLTMLDPDGYDYYWELEKCLDALREETRLYIEEQKWGVKQQSLFGDMDAEFEDEIEVEQTPGITPSSAAEAMVSELASRPKRGRKPKSESQPLTC